MNSLQQSERYRHLNNYLKNTFGERTLKMVDLLVQIEMEHYLLKDAFFVVNEDLANIFHAITYQAVQNP